jgi:hypothetical protein
MTFETVRKFESVFGAALPADYRVFLTTHSSKYLEPSLLVRHMAPVPGSGAEDVVTALYTAADILDSELLGEPEEKMVIIGLVEPGGYLYMCFSATDFGTVYIRFPFQDSTFYPVGRSFSDFMARCRPDPESDA